MGARTSILRRYGKHNLRILLLGLDAAGKTTVLNTLKLGRPKETMPTIGFNVEELRYGNLDLHIWDVGGQDRLRPLWRPHYRGTSGILFIVDSSDINRIKLAKKELHALLKEEEIAGTSICILANKQDLPDAVSPDSLYTHLEVSCIEQHGFLCTVLPAVASKGEGLQAALEWLAQHMKPI